MAEFSFLSEEWIAALAKGVGLEDATGASVVAVVARRSEDVEDESGAGGVP